MSSPSPIASDSRGVPSNDSSAKPTGITKLFSTPSPNTPPNSMAKRRASSFSIPAASKKMENNLPVSQGSGSVDSEKSITDKSELFLLMLHAKGERTTVEVQKMLKYASVLRDQPWVKYHIKESDNCFINNHGKLVAISCDFP